jgi:hypothetical protein
MFRGVLYNEGNIRALTRDDKRLTSESLSKEFSLSSRVAAEVAHGLNAVLRIVGGVDSLCLKAGVKQDETERIAHNFFHSIKTLSRAQQGSRENAATRLAAQLSLRGHLEVTAMRSLLLRGAEVLARIRDVIIEDDPQGGATTYAEVLQYATTRWWWKWARRLGVLGAVSIAAYLGKQNYTTLEAELREQLHDKDSTLGELREQLSSMQASTEADRQKHYDQGHNDALNRLHAGEVLVHD